MRIFLLFFLVFFFIKSISADINQEVKDVKNEFEEIKEIYEEKIEALEAKVKKLEQEKVAHQKQLRVPPWYRTLVVPPLEYTP